MSGRFCHALHKSGLRVACSSRPSRSRTRVRALVLCANKAMSASATLDSGTSSVPRYQFRSIRRTTLIMKISNIDARRRIAGISAGLLCSGAWPWGSPGAPSAVAAPDCSPARCEHHRFLGDRRGAAISCRASRRQPGGYGRLRPAPSAGGVRPSQLFHRRIPTSTTTCAAFWHRSATPNGNAM